MRLPLLISLSLLLPAAQKVGAQLAPAEDFFHSGAQFYISNNIPQAKEQVEMGRKLYPDDEKLKKLEELLKQQSQQQNQQQQNQQNQSQQQKSDDQKNQQQSNQPEQKSQEQQKQDEQKKSQADQKKDEAQKQPEQQKSSAQKKDDQKPDDKTGEGQPVKPGEMTPEEAKRLLDAQKGDEQVLQLKPPTKPENQTKPIKDW